MKQKKHNRNADLDSTPRVALLSLLLENRKLGMGMLGGGLVYFVISLFGYSIMPCPVHTLTRLQCPGCGLTRACKALIHGDWARAFHFHWFAPVFALFWILVAIGLVLPQPSRSRFLKWVKWSERHTYWPIFLGVGLLIYALTRNVMGG